MAGIVRLVESSIRLYSIILVFLVVQRYYRGKLAKTKMAAKPKKLR